MQQRSMLSRDELMRHPNYLLTTYQLKIYGLLKSYMKDNKIKRQKDVAKKLEVSDAYVSQILNGECNFSLKKLIELGLKLGSVPYLEFITPNEYFHKEAEVYANAQKKVVEEYKTSGNEDQSGFDFKQNPMLTIAHLTNLESVLKSTGNDQNKKEQFTFILNPGYVPKAV